MREKENQAPLKKKSVSGAHRSGPQTSKTPRSSSRTSARAAKARISSHFEENGALDDFAESQAWIENLVDHKDLYIPPLPPVRQPSVQPKGLPLSTPLKSTSNAPTDVSTPTLEERVVELEGRMAEITRKEKAWRRERAQYQKRVRELEEEVSSTKRVLLDLANLFLRDAEVEPPSSVILDGGYLIRRGFVEHISHRFRNM
ncbi:hypothetical protein CC1G_08088 [Coprinopsis cinerea okayama7|uniref:Uncharacterized protein n=1 Tax=Coprinopsis cinerea (strain Okayama-7 / 130 / ATCC MYA-4618 / FGSC 9003) TaxID=240176 RepID=A8NVF9_COPC7|nr:hypothetical protein CC1G_08088 [Coprinopsis cinerea okayama7\|eukprot:XP_001836703.1 hypothetical protein CC1G_08088 [Coprinopsis cinerea okayama7\